MAASAARAAAPCSRARRTAGRRSRARAARRRRARARGTRSRRRALRELALVDAPLGRGVGRVRREPQLGRARAISARPSPSLERRREVRVGSGSSAGGTRAARGARPPRRSAPAVPEQRARDAVRRAERAADRVAPTARRPRRVLGTASARPRGRPRRRRPRRGLALRCVGRPHERLEQLRHDDRELRAPRAAWPTRAGDRARAPTRRRLGGARRRRRPPMRGGARVEAAARRARARAPRRVERGRARPPRRS